jgi:hypothetical protein
MGTKSKQPQARRPCLTGAGFWVKLSHRRPFAFEAGWFKGVLQDLFFSNVDEYTS